MAPRVNKCIIRLGEFIALGAVFIITVFFSIPLEAQWYKLKEFDIPVSVITFFEQNGNPTIGFVGVGYSADLGDDPNSFVWKTTDGGISWEKSIFTRKPWGGITNFCFKDNLVGWLSLGHGGIFVNEASCYKTIDGGITWFPTALSTSVNNYFNGSSSVYYNKSNNFLFLSSWNSDIMVSSDLGTIWTNVIIGPNTNGFAFINDNQGILSRVSQLGTGYFNFYITNDGGLTWSKSDFLEECWQPLAIQGTSIFYCIGDLSHNVYRSDDAGFTWTIISNVPGAGGHITGDLDKLYLNGEGIFVSEDQGVTWKSICGPKPQFTDTRFYARDNYVYAADSYRLQTGLYPEFGRLWVNTTSNGSGERLLLSHSSGNRDFDLLAGNTWSVNLALPDTFSTIQWLKLDSLSFTLRFEGDVLSFKDAIASSGWRVVNAQESPGRVFVKLVRESGSDRGVPVATVNFQANIAREKESDVYIDSVFYNAGEFTNCEVLASEKLHITINDECGDSTLREFINSKPILEIVSITPNPTRGDVTVDFNTLVGGDVNFELYDNTARRLKQEKVPVTAGITSKAIDLSQFSSGTYFVQLTLGKDVVTGKFVKQ